MRFSFLALALTLAGCSTAPPPAPAPAPRPIDQMTRIELVPANGYAFSYDGRTLIFSASVGGAIKAFSVPVSGGDPTDLSEDDDTHVVSYFPGDDRILLRVGNRLVVRERDETTHDLGSAAFQNWCSDGSASILASGGLYILDTSNYQRRFVLPVAAEDVLNMQLAAVSRDCRWAAVTNRSPNAIYLADLTSPQPAPHQILSQIGASGVFGFTPTNQSLIYSQRQGSGFVEAYRYSLSDNQNYLVMQTQADVMAIEFSPSGRYGAYYSGTNGQITDVAVVDQTSDQAVPLSSGTRDLRFNRDETKIAFRLANDGWPADIFVSDLDGGHITRLVHAPNAH